MYFNHNIGTGTELFIPQDNQKELKEYYLVELPANVIPPVLYNQGFRNFNSDNPNTRIDLFNNVRNNDSFTRYDEQSSKSIPPIIRPYNIHYQDTLDITNIPNDLNKVTKFDVELNVNKLTIELLLNSSANHYILFYFVPDYRLKKIKVTFD